MADQPTAANVRPAAAIVVNRIALQSCLFLTGRVVSFAKILLVKSADANLVRCKFRIQLADKQEEIVVKRSGDEAQLDELGKDPGQVGPNSAGQSGDPQGLSSTRDISEESVEELADTDQAFEASIVEGVEDATDHPERPVHTHLEYGRPDDVPPEQGSR
jgi:hypothetical protein